MGVSGAGDGGGGANAFPLHVEELDEDEPPLWMALTIAFPEVLDLHVDGDGAWLLPSNVKSPSTSE